MCLPRLRGVLLHGGGGLLREVRKSPSWCWPGEPVMLESSASSVKCCSLFMDHQNSPHYLTTKDGFKILLVIIASQKEDLYIGCRPLMYVSLPLRYLKSFCLYNRTGKGI